MSKHPAPPGRTDDKRKTEHKPPATAETNDELGSNAVEHEPDPLAEPLPDGHHKHVPRSPYTAGNI